MLIFENLKEEVFSLIDSGNNTNVITGYIGIEMVKDLSSRVDSDSKANVYIGMYGRNINSIIHENLVKFTDKNPNLKIFYTDTLVHSKVYISNSNEDINNVYIGSANFSTNGLCSYKGKEILTDVRSDDFDKVKAYLDFVKEISTPVADVDIQREIGIGEAAPIFVDVNIVKLSLLSSQSNNTPNIIGVTTGVGEVHASGGLNWGFSNAMPKPSDAYIPIRMEVIRNNKTLFPQKRSGENIPFDVIWDDGTSMQVLLEGNNNIEGQIFPKQISTFKNKTELGDYLRKRIQRKLNIELAIPQEVNDKDRMKTNPEEYKDKFITKGILEAYGRTDITIKKIDESNYYFDFSV